MKAQIAIATLALLAVPAHASEEMAEALAWIAPIVESGELEQLGGPETAEDIVAGLEGRWFTLDNTVRNWTQGSTRDRLGESIERLCADDWENIVRFEPLGPDSFRIIQTSPEGEDQGTLDMATMDGERKFTAEHDEAYLTEIFERRGDSGAELERLLGEMKAIFDAGEEIWLPHPDIQVIRTVAEVEVWGRCPE